MDRAFAAALIVSLAGAFVAVGYFDDRRWIRQLRARLIYGIPVGSVLVVLGLLGVYLFLQRGFWTWDDPLVVPFRAWSYLYPTGMLTAGFTHASPSHLIGNLSATVVLAPLVEYLWGHYPRSDGGRSTCRDDALWRIPIVRAALIFPGVTLVVGILTAAFSLGPVIGFSAVVFAYAGFAVVIRPLLTLVAVLAIGGVRVVYRALKEPVVVAAATPSPPTVPGWAEVAIQGHAIGFLFGIFLGVALAHRRGTRPSPGRFFVAVILYAISQQLWAVYRYAGNDTYVLYRAGGVILVVLVALVLVGAVVGSKRPLPAVGHFEIVPTRRQTAMVAVGLILATLIGPAIPLNLSTDTADPPPINESVAVGDYTVTYQEEVRNRIVPVIEAPGFELAAINTSGVIVSSDRRHVWTQQISASRLASTGHETVTVGGVGWSETVDVDRTGWDVLGGETVYTVDLTADNRTVQAFASDASTSTVYVDDHRFQLFVAEDGEFALRIRSPNETTVTRLPARNETVVVDWLTITVSSLQNGPTVVVNHNGTRTPIATKERY